MDNLKFIILECLAAKKSWILDWHRFLWLVLKQLVYLEGNVLQTSYRAAYNTLRDNALHTQTQHQSVDRNRGAAACLQRLCSTWYAMPPCDAIIVYTISWMLPAVAAAVIITSNVRCWSWVRLCCVWRIFPRDQSVHFTEKSVLRAVNRANFIRYWRRSGLKNPDKLKIFIKKNIRYHLYHQFYPVLAKIRINRFRINRGLL